MNKPTLPASALAALGLSIAILQLPAAQTGPPRRVLAADDSTQRLAIVAPDGSLEWELKVGAIHDAWQLPNGNLLLQQGWQKVVEVTPDKRTVWEYDSGKMNGNEGQRVVEKIEDRVQEGHSRDGLMRNISGFDYHENLTVTVRISWYGLRKNNPCRGQHG